MRNAFALVIAAALVVACDREPAQVHVGRNDTLVIHNGLPTAVPAVVTNAKGKILPKARTTFQVLGGDVLRAVDSSGVECTGNGDGVIKLTAGRASTDVTVQCRPIAYILVRHDMTLATGGPAVPLDIAAMGVDKKPLTELAVQAVVRDTSVAVIQNGEVHPRGAGRTVIDVSIGCRTWIVVTVYAPGAAADTMSLPHLGAYASREIPHRVACAEWVGSALRPR